MMRLGFRAWCPTILMAVLIVLSCRNPPRKDGTSAARASASIPPSPQVPQLLELGFRHEEGAKGGTFLAVVDAQKWSCPLLEYAAGERCRIVYFYYDGRDGDEVVEVSCGLRVSQHATIEYNWVGGVKAIRSPLGACSLPVSSEETEVKIGPVEDLKLESCAPDTPETVHQLRLVQHLTPKASEMKLTVPGLGWAVTLAEKPEWEALPADLACFVYASKAGDLSAKCRSTGLTFNMNVRVQNRVLTVDYVRESQHEDPIRGTLGGLVLPCGVRLQARPFRSGDPKLGYDGMSELLKACHANSELCEYGCYVRYVPESLDSVYKSVSELTACLDKCDVNYRACEMRSN